MQNILRALDCVERTCAIENTALERNRDALLNDQDFSNKFLGLDKPVAIHRRENHP